VRPAPHESRALLNGRRKSATACAAPLFEFLIFDLRFDLPTLDAQLSIKALRPSRLLCVFAVKSDSLNRKDAGVVAKVAKELRAEHRERFFNRKIANQKSKISPFVLPSAIR
jgi:hypothetical protein